MARKIKNVSIPTPPKAVKPEKYADGGFATLGEAFRALGETLSSENIPDGSVSANEVPAHTVTVNAHELVDREDAALRHLFRNGLLAGLRGAARALPAFDESRITGVSPGNAEHQAAAAAGPADIVAPLFDEDPEPVSTVSAPTPRPMRPGLNAAENTSLDDWEMVRDGGNRDNRYTESMARDGLAGNLEQDLLDLATIRHAADRINGLSVPEYMFDFAIRLFWPASYLEFVSLNDTSVMSRVARRLMLNVVDAEYMNRIALKIRLTKELCRVMEHDPAAWGKLVGDEATNTPFNRSNDGY